MESLVQRDKENKRKQNINRNYQTNTNMNNVVKANKHYRAPTRTSMVANEI